jgi:hypothetical protein
VELELEELMTRPDGPFVARLPREPGRREARYMHLFGGEAPPVVEHGMSGIEGAADGASQLEQLAERVRVLEETVSGLRIELDSLQRRYPTASAT